MAEKNLCFLTFNPFSYKLYNNIIFQKRLNKEQIFLFDKLKLKVITLSL